MNAKLAHVSVYLFRIYSRLGCSIIKAHLNCSAIMKIMAAFTKFTQFYSPSPKSVSFIIIFFSKCFIFHMYFTEGIKEKSPLSPALCTAFFTVGTSHLHETSTLVE